MMCRDGVNSHSAVSGHCKKTTVWLFTDRQKTKKANRIFSTFGFARHKSPRFAKQKELNLPTHNFNHYICDNEKRNQNISSHFTFVLLHQHRVWIFRHREESQFWKRIALLHSPRQQRPYNSNRQVSSAFWHWIWYSKSIKFFGQLDRQEFHFLFSQIFFSPRQIIFVVFLSPGLNTSLFCFTAWQDWAVSIFYSHH